MIFFTNLLHCFALLLYFTILLHESEEEDEEIPQTSYFLNYRLLHLFSVDKKSTYFGMIGLIESMKSLISNFSVF
jgi:hypothetical protein